MWKSKITVLCVSCFIIACVFCSCNNAPKPEKAAHYIEVADDLPAFVEHIVGMSYNDVIAKFGTPDFTYYYPAQNVEDADTVIVPVITALWDLSTSPYQEAQQILDALVSEDDELSGFCAAELIVNFKSEQNGFTAIQATLE